MDRHHTSLSQYFCVFVADLLRHCQEVLYSPPQLLCGHLLALEFFESKYDSTWSPRGETARLLDACPIMIVRGRQLVPVATLLDGGEARDLEFLPRSSNGEHPSAL